jgi:hypothetical protein
MPLVDIPSDRVPVIFPPKPAEKVRERRLNELIKRFEQCLDLSKDQRADSDILRDLRDLRKCLSPGQE